MLHKVFVQERVPFYGILVSCICRNVFSSISSNYLYFLQKLNFHFSFSAVVSPEYNSCSLLVNIYAVSANKDLIYRLISSMSDRKTALFSLLPSSRQVAINGIN